MDSGKLDGNAGLGLECAVYPHSLQLPLAPALPHPRPLLVTDKTCDKSVSEAR